MTVAVATPLLRISLDGRVVAEATLEVCDPERAWPAFEESMATLSPLVVYHELINVMRIACDEQLRAEHGDQGFIFELELPAVEVAS